MFLSIIIPVYNADDYIDRCLTSILSYPSANIELIIIDDCSTDGTSKKLEYYSRRDKRIRLLTNATNMLAGYSRNLGLKHARGEYIWFIDADDWIGYKSIERLEKMVRTKPGTQIFSFGFAEHYAGKRQLIIYKFPYMNWGDRSALMAFLLLKNGYSSMPFSYLFNRSFIQSNRIPFPEGVYFEDLFFMGQLFFYATKIELIPKIYYHYDRSNYHSITLSHSRKKIMDLIRIYEKINLFLKEKKVCEASQKLLVFRFLIYGLPRCFRMYLRLSAKERKDKDLRKLILEYRRSDIMSRRSLIKAWNISNRLSRGDTNRMMELRRNSILLWQIKYSLPIMEFYASLKSMSCIVK